MNPRVADAGLAVGYAGEIGKEVAKELDDGAVLHNHPAVTAEPLRERAAKTMGHQIKIQRVERGATKSYYVNFPTALAEAAQIEKGEGLEWLVEDRNTFLLRRLKPKKSILKDRAPLT